ncbi:hypothetical protein KKE60_08145 [Patescibacteria group bacterium]|nr:hypothetical protein [Patescibacteria group bacterium]
MSMRKYNREQKVKDDKQQTMLDPKSPSFIKSKKKVIISITETYTGAYMCPFCLHSDRINAYLISTKKGYHKGLGHCPECNNQMQIKTLTSDMTPEQFAQFAYEYSSQGYWQKVKFEQFNNRLHAIGWSKRFWAKYRELKGDSDQTESYQQYVARKQEEWAKEQGLTP